MTKPGCVGPAWLGLRGPALPACRPEAGHAYQYVPIATGASESSVMLIESTRVALLEVLRREMVAGPLSLE